MYYVITNCVKNCCIYLYFRFVLYVSNAARKYLLHLQKMEARGGVVVKALRYKPAGRGFNARWYHWNFPVT
jgi:hypothetical protein